MNNNNTEVFVLTQWGNVRVVCWGDPVNPPLLTLHGISGNAESFREALFSVPEATPLRAFYVLNVIVPDRGVLHAYHPFPSLRGLAMIISSVVEHFNLANFIGVGEGASGHVLLLYALAHPGQLRSLVLINTTSGRASPMERLIGTLSLSMRRQLQSIRNSMGVYVVMRHEARELPRRARVRNVLRYVAIVAGLALEAIARALNAHLLFPEMTEEQMEFTAHFLQREDLDLSPLANNIPILIIADPEQSEFLHSAERILEDIPNAAMPLIPPRVRPSSRILLADLPEAVASEIVSFLQQNQLLPPPQLPQQLPQAGGGANAPQNLQNGAALQPLAIGGGEEQPGNNNQQQEVGERRAGRVPLPRRSASDPGPRRPTPQNDGGAIPVAENAQAILPPQIPNVGELDVSVDQSDVSSDSSVSSVEDEGEVDDEDVEDEEEMEDEDEEVEDEEADHEEQTEPSDEEEDPEGNVPVEEEEEEEEPRPRPPQLKTGNEKKVPGRPLLPGEQPIEYAAVSNDAHGSRHKTGGSNKTGTLDVNRVIREEHMRCNNQSMTKGLLPKFDPLASPFQPPNCSGQVQATNIFRLDTPQRRPVFAETLSSTQLDGNGDANSSQGISRGFEGISGPPKFTQQLNSVTDLVEGQPAHFEAMVEPVADPRLRIQWFHNGRPLAASNRVSYRNDFGLVTLDVHYVLPQDIGDYRCVATNDAGEAATEGHLDCHQRRADLYLDPQHPQSWVRIQEPEAPRPPDQEAPEPQAFAKPQFTQAVQSLADVPEGSAAVFQGRVIPVGDPNLQILWFRDDQPLGQSNRFAMHQDFGFVALHIAGVTVHDAGVYSCKAVNLEGAAISSAHLSVAGDVRIHTDPLHAQSYARIQELEAIDKHPKLAFPDREYQKPQWTQTFQDADVETDGGIVQLIGLVEPAQDPDLRVEWFLNGVPLMNANRFRQDYAFGQAMLTIIHVLPHDTGVYSCRAWNAAGEATTSATVKVAGYEAILKDTQHPVSRERIQEPEAPKIVEEAEAETKRAVMHKVVVKDAEREQKTVPNALMDDKDGECVQSYAIVDEHDEVQNAAGERARVEELDASFQEKISRRFEGVSKEENKN